MPGMAPPMNPVICFLNRQDRQVACQPRRLRPTLGRLSFASILMIGLPGTALALPADGGLPSDPAVTTNLVQLVLGLLVVLGTIFVGAWLLRRFGRVPSAIGGAIRIVGGLSMGPRERVILLQVGDTQLLLGVTPGKIQSLHVLDEPVTQAEINSDGGGFASRLAAAIRPGSSQ